MQCSSLQFNSVQFTAVQCSGWEAKLLCFLCLYLSKINPWNLLLSVLQTAECFCLLFSKWLQWTEFHFLLMCLSEEALLLLQSSHILPDRTPSDVTWQVKGVGKRTLSSLTGLVFHCRRLCAALWGLTLHHHRGKSTGWVTDVTFIHLCLQPSVSGSANANANYLCYLVVWRCSDPPLRLLLHLLSHWEQHQQNIVFNF